MNLDEYWVASLFVEFATDKAPASRFAPLSTLIAIVILLTFAVSARAEPVSGATATAAVAAVTSDPAPAPQEPAQASPTEPAPASAVEPVQVKEVATAAKSTVAATQSDLPVTVPAGTATPRSVPSPREVGVLVKAKPDNAVAATTGKVSELAGDVRRDSAAAATRLVDRADPTAAAHIPVRAATQVLHNALGAERLSELSRVVAAAASVPLQRLPDVGSQAGVALADNGTPWAGIPPASAGIESPAGARVAFPARNLRPAVSWRVASLPSRDQAVLAELLAGNSPTFTGAEPVKLKAPGDPELIDAQAVLASAGSAIPGERPSDRSPLDAPVPLPGPSGSSSGASGSVFVPFAALFALLALTAPASRRRLWEGPAYRPSIPFVCGLERPG
jgi:hypothetical protein